MSENRKPPNFMLIVVDDMGYSDCAPFGGEIATPNLARLADAGARFRGFYVSSLCAPTRSLLLTGVDNHQNGLGVMPPMHRMNQFGQPGYEGTLNRQVVTLAEVLRDAGYATLFAGKWHLGKNEGERPEHRGFDRVFSLLGGGASHFDDVLPLAESERPQTLYDHDGRDVTNSLPEGFYSTTHYTDRMIEFLSDAGTERPFFGYLAYTAPHDPLQVPDEWFETYRGRYDGGYDAIRAERHARMQTMGLIPADLPVNEGSGQFPRWTELSDEERVSQSRKMEIYAAMIELFDEGIGRVIDHLKASGQYDDTVFVFMSDNGANPKEPHFYTKSTPEEIDRAYDNSPANMGRKGSFVSIGAGWAEVCNTPLSYFKLTTSEGGVQVPLIVSGPEIARRGIVTDQTLHATDIFPTFLDYAGIARPDTYHRGQPLAPLYGRSWRPYLEATSHQPVRGPFDAIGFEMIECKAVIKGGWKLLYMAPPYGNDEWFLFNLHDDPEEKVNIAERHPRKFDEMMAEWTAYARAVGYIEAQGKAALEEMSSEEFFTRYGISGR